MGIRGCSGHSIRLQIFIYLSIHQYMAGKSTVIKGSVIKRCQRNNQRDSGHAVDEPSKVAFFDKLNRSKYDDKDAVKNVYTETISRSNIKNFIGDVLNQLYHDAHVPPISQHDLRIYFQNFNKYILY